MPVSKSTTQPQTAFVQVAQKPGCIFGLTSQTASDTMKVQIKQPKGGKVGNSMKKEARRQYEAILLNAITKEGSKWELYDKGHIIGEHFEVFSYDYKLDLPNKVTLWTTIEYDAKDNSYQVVYLARRTYCNFKHRGARTFRWLRFLDRIEEDYLETKQF